MKKGKSLTFQLKDSHEKELYDYCKELHNCSGTIKRLIANSEGFKEWSRKKRIANTPVHTIKEQGAIKFSL